MKIYYNPKKDIFVKHTVDQDDGEFFGMCYWQIESPERHTDYIGTLGYTYDLNEIENNPEWVPLVMPELPVMAFPYIPEDNMPMWGTHDNMYAGL